MIQRPTRAICVTLLTSALVLGGCSQPPGGVPAPSGSASTTTASASTSAAGTESESLAGRSGTFSLVPPEGWSDATDKASGVAGVDLVVLSSKKVASFNNNLVVTTSQGDASVLEGELERGRSDMAAAGRTVVAAPDKTVGGETAKGFTTHFTKSGIKVVARSYGLTHAGRLYLLTLSSSEQDADHAMREFDELVAGWDWT